MRTQVDCCACCPGCGWQVGHLGMTPFQCIEAPRSKDRREHRYLAFRPCFSSSRPCLQSTSKESPAKRLLGGAFGGGHCLCFYPAPGSDPSGGAQSMFPCLPSAIWAAGADLPLCVSSTFAPGGLHTNASSLSRAALVDSGELHPSASACAIARSKYTATRRRGQVKCG
jgi:hypothetical protein